MNSFTENACANFLASLNMSDAGIIPFDFVAFDEIITESMYDSIFEYDNPTRKEEKRKTRKGNIKNKNRDRIHGRRHGGAHGGIDFRYIDCNPYCNKHRYQDAMFATNGKHRHNADRKALAMSAREKEYYSYAEYLVEQAQAKAEAKQETKEAGFYEFLWYLIDTLPEGKFIVLYNYDNGMSYEDHVYATNQFLGVKTKDEIITKLTEEFLCHEGVDVNETKVQGLKGIEFNWDSEDSNYWGGYEDFTIIPLSSI